MHLISELRVINFRSCEDTFLRLQEFSPLVGYNNAGKSNILKALDALVRAKGLNESDFNDPDKPVVITALLTGLSDQVLGYLPAAQRTSLEAYIEGGAISIRFFQSKPGSGKNSVELGVRVPSNPLEEWSNPNGIPQAISALFPEPTFINSMEDSAEDVSRFKAGNTIGKLISILQKEVLLTKGSEISGALSVIGRKLNVDGAERLQEFADFDRSVNAKVGDFFPGLELSIHVPTPDIADLFKQGTIRVVEQGSKRVSDFNNMGHGAQRAIQMTLIRHLAELSKDIAKEGKTNLLLIDEPELFLHPQAIELVRSSLKLLATKGYQVVFSTHSPFMIEHSDIPITNIVRKGLHGTRVEVRLREAIDKVLKDKEAQARILFDTYNLSQILFSDVVLIAEGDTEKHVLPSLFAAVTGNTLGASKLALVIASGASNIPGMMQILNEMNIQVKALADLDFAFVNAHKHGLLERGDESVDVCLNVIHGLQASHGFVLNGRYPASGDGFKASDVYELLAAESDAKEHINKIRDKLRMKSVWVWGLGAIEPHLCLDTKATGEWFKFKERLSLEPISNVVHDVDHIKEFVEWCMA